MNNITKDVNIIGGISFDNLMALKAEHALIYESGAGEQIELLNYLYDILDNINSEIIKQNKQRIKAKYGSLLPPAAIRNRGVQQPNSETVLDDTVVGGDDDGFQPVMPRRLVSSSVKPNGRSSSIRAEGSKKTGRGGARSSGPSSSYNQQYRPENERIPRGESSRVSRGDIGRGVRLDSERSRQGQSGNNRPRISESSSTGNGGVLSRLMGVDRVKMSINREMNKLSSTNMDVIADSITDVFASWLLDELNKDTAVNDLIEQHGKYLVELWNNLIAKSLAQDNMSEVYFKFLRRIMNPLPNGQNSIMLCLRSKSPIMAGRLGSWQPGFHELAEYKSDLLDEIIEFLNQSAYFEGDIAATELAIKVGGGENLANIQQAFSILGLFAKYFMEPPSRNSKAPSAWDIMLLAIYSNFKLLNELLYWEPVNLEEVERRVFFTVGFLEDNRGFIQSLDTDFYRDIECQLDSIKKCASIPASVKYKLFDCIDNFILMRKSGTSGRK